MTLWKTGRLHCTCFTEVVQGNPQIQIHVDVWSVKQDGRWRGGLCQPVQHWICQPVLLSIPLPHPQSSLGTAQSSFRFHVSVLWCCCCCFLLWAEFYTVCQSPERHTLEGPVEWDTKSDPSGEQLVSHLPPLSVCLSLSSSPSLPLSPSGLIFLLSAYPSLCPHLLLFLRLHQQIPRLLAKSERVRSPLFGEATLHTLSAWVVGQAQPTSHSMHHSECATNEHDWRNVPVPVPCLFCLISFTLNRGTVYNDSVRNKERTYPVRWPWNVCGNLSNETEVTLQTLCWLLREKVNESHEDPERKISQRTRSL